MAGRQTRLKPVVGLGAPHQSGLGPNELEVARERLTPVAAPAEDLIKSTTDSLDGMQVQDFREAIQDAKPSNDPLSEDSNENMQKLRAKL